MTCAMLCGPSSPATTPSGWSRRTDTAAQPRCAPPGRRRPSSAPHNAAYCPDSRVRYRHRCRCCVPLHAKQFPAAGQLALALTVAEEPEVADAVKAVREDMNQEPADELVGVQGHRAVVAVLPVVL